MFNNNFRKYLLLKEKGRENSSKLRICQSKYLNSGLEHQLVEDVLSDDDLIVELEKFNAQRRWRKDEPKTFEVKSLGSGQKANVKTNNYMFMLFIMVAMIFSNFSLV